MIDLDDEVDLLTADYDWEAEESTRGVWMRACPHCSATLCKISLRETVRCACGWEWQA
jgi:hypothetical protein